MSTPSPLSSIPSHLILRTSTLCTQSRGDQINKAIKSGQHLQFHLPLHIISILGPLMIATTSSALTMALSLCGPPTCSRSAFFFYCWVMRLPTLIAFGLGLSKEPRTPLCAEPFLTDFVRGCATSSSSRHLKEEPGGVLCFFKFQKSLRWFFYHPHIHHHHTMWDPNTEWHLTSPSKFFYTPF